MQKKPAEKAYLIFHISRNWSNFYAKIFQSLAHVCKGNMTNTQRKILTPKSLHQKLFVARYSCMCVLCTNLFPYCVDFHKLFCQTFLRSSIGMNTHTQDYK